MGDPQIPPPPDGSAVVDAGQIPPPPDGSGIVDPNAGTGATIGAAPSGAKQWLSDAENDVRTGTRSTIVGKALGALGATGTDSGVTPGSGDTLASPVLGPLHAAQGIADMREHPVRGALKAAGGALETASLPASFVAPEVSEAAAGKFTAAGIRAKASGAFNSVAAAADKAPIDITEPGMQALKIDALSSRGGTQPKIIRDFIKRVTDPEKGPLTYDEARDFYSNATRLSGNEYSKLTDRMKMEMGQFTKVLGEAVQDAATRVGKGADYNFAMKQWKRASSLSDTYDTLKSMAAEGAKKVAIGAGLGAGYKAVDTLTGDKKK
jgi:hypothetical protein